MRVLIFFSLLLFLSACSPQPEPISYGSDLCHYCKMTIVDQQHASEAITDKGKIFKFDAIECMLPYVLEQPTREYSFLLVNDYENPSQLVPAETSTFLIAEAIPSPMGGFLSAFSDDEKAKLLASNHNGDLHTWSELKKLYQSKIANPD